MAKEAPTLSKEERRALKAAKKEAKSSSKPEGVTKPEKKDKKDKKEKTVLAERALKEIQNAPTTKEDEEEDEDEVPEKTKGETESKKVNGIRPVGALVPFANPLADEKVAKKVFKGVKKAAGARTLKRGVKEVVKALRKSTSLTTPSQPASIVILAADISPMDVISHIPVLCEDHNVPYIYVSSRAELGIAGQTKRPTSVVLLGREGTGKGKGEEGSEWEGVFEGLCKVVQREGASVRV